MSEIRYIKIKSCRDCMYDGHSSNVYNSVVTFFCTNSINSDVDRPREKVSNQFYPITHLHDHSSTNIDIRSDPIPSWCKLPSNVD